MIDIQKEYNEVVDKYIKVFEAHLDIEFEGWVGDEVGEVAAFGDFFFNFSDIRYVVDNAIPSDDLFNWQDFNTQFPKCYHNIDAFVKLLKVYRYESGFAFKIDNFEKHLLYLRIKSND